MRLSIRKTKEKDLVPLMQMWNDGSVMHYVGFPQGLGMDEAKMQKWFHAVSESMDTNHYSIVESKIGFCGETFYSWKDKNLPALLDIKLVQNARGKQIAKYALSFCIDQLFRSTKAQVAKVDPHCDNLAAIHLYQSLGFQEKVNPDQEDTTHLYFEITRVDWTQRRIASVSLQDVTKENFISVCLLSVQEGQKHFIASNAFSLAQSKYQPECIPQAIYADINLVGFIMYCLDQEDQTYWIYRLMIDENYQGLGYGKRAMEIALNRLMPLSSNHLIRISFEPENSVAKQLYEHFGFYDTGRIEGGEAVYDKTW